MLKRRSSCFPENWIYVEHSPFHSYYYKYWIFFFFSHWNSLYVLSDPLHNLPSQLLFLYKKKEYMSYVFYSLQNRHQLTWSTLWRKNSSWFWGFSVVLYKWSKQPVLCFYGIGADRSSWWSPGVLFWLIYSMLRETLRVWRGLLRWERLNSDLSSGGFVEKISGFNSSLNILVVSLDIFIIISLKIY